MEIYEINHINHDISLQQYLKKLITSEVCKIGFELCGFAKVTEWDEIQNLKQWVVDNLCADMMWFAKTLPVRKDIRKWFPEVKSIIAVGENYYHNCDNSYVALYAHGIDYHIRMRNKLKNIAEFVKKIVKGGKCRISVDSSPVHEKYWAKKAGLGWQGKNTLIINPVYGSWFNIGILAVNFVLPEDVQLDNHCGECSKCVDVCPTNALLYPGVLDANKCISYHTVENRKLIPDEISNRNKRYIFGCDFCQIVCPWNRKTPVTPRPDACDEKVYEGIKQILNSGDIPTFSVFNLTSMKRLGLKLLKRNASLLT
ncbi:MAG: tRNA epoxyqueuosine(34) reductase QueG [Candidatus Hydrogenedentes bacterium]|nr:tRNA epoxyqueuosine(34) reductase QueG [Candidatus Hydrogenedentota bacterium]